MGDGFSIAWRILDARFWGVPQRRRRIALVADFGGASAPEILFVRKSLSWDSASGKETREASPFGDENSAAGCDRAEFNGHKSVTDSIQHKRASAPTIAQVCPDAAHALWAQGTCAYAEDKETYVICMSTGQAKAETITDGSPTLNCNHEQPIVFDCRGNGDGKTVPTITGDHENRVTDYSSVVLPTVRRLTPLECERLQGYPDNWTNIPPARINGKITKPSDTARYKALGNSIALPPWKWVLKRLCAQYERDATLGSLFDGIGGFPLIWEQLNGKGSCRWISEIEAFPLAVTKFHFGEENTDE